ncbi:MAG TPA: LPS assembly lipoprotein LptE [Advenella sp.]|nr:LPS assembly lipoprotein LptE [Advenella sp.]
MVYSFSFSRWHQALLAAFLLSLVLAGCGFKLRGEKPLPFTTMYTNIESNSRFGAYLRRSLKASSPSLQFVDNASAAQVTLSQLERVQSQREVSLNSQGQVEEYELTLRLTFQLVSNSGQLLIPPSTLTSTRTLPYDEANSQAKAQEMITLYQDMEAQMVGQLVRRISSDDVIQGYQQGAGTPGEEQFVR